MKNKKNIIMIIVICLLGVGIGYLLFNSSDNGLVELNYNELTTKIENKEDFVVCISRTTCSHCNDYKPKLRKVANKYKINIYYTDIDKYNKTDLEKFNKLISFDGGTPVTIFIKNGEEKTTATRIEGDVSTDKIIDKLKKNGFIEAITISFQQNEVPYHRECLFEFVATLHRKSELLTIQNKVGLDSEYPILYYQLRLHRY
jgi:predicted bacteriocin transport accessory protein